MQAEGQESSLLCKAWKDFCRPHDVHGLMNEENEGGKEQDRMQK